jgi:RNA polymerase sigma factor (sigma-70 family)
MPGLLMTMPSAQPDAAQDVVEDCIAAVARGEKDALAKLYEETYGAVYGYALSIVKNGQDAEDVLQDTYLKIWEGAGTYRPMGKPLAWIFTITRNLARMLLREQKRSVTVEPQDWEAVFAGRPEMNYEDRLVLLALLEILNSEERQIVMLHALAGWKHREIAKFCKISLTATLSKYSRAMKKLRNAWKEADSHDKS